MKNLSFLSFLLVSCSALTPRVYQHREIAAVNKDGPVKFNISMNQSIVFANGADSVYLTIKVTNENNEPVLIEGSELKVLVDGEATIGKILYKDGAFTTSIRPKLLSPNLRAVVLYRNQFSQIVEIKTSIKPRIEKMAGTKTTYSWGSVDGMQYRSDVSAPKGQKVAFEIENNEPNTIITEEEVSRNFKLVFEEQARQNLALLVTDRADSKDSHGMYSHFVIFPRQYLPFVKKNEREEFEVTLPNGETMLFAPTGEILDGVFEEGPVDVNPEYKARTFADFRYQGKGIVLRANARGLLPQQGQFETNKIDMDFGVKNSFDALIINGATGQRCRRPKSDFWSSADVQPVLFKFPSDKEFDAYLRTHCGFGIPSLNINIGVTQKKDATKELNEAWSKCDKDANIKSCFLNEVDSIADKDIAARVKFDGTIKYLTLKKEEQKKIPTMIATQSKEIQATLLKDASWFSQGCEEKSRSLVKNELKYHDTQSLMKEAISENCAKVRSEMTKVAETEALQVKAKLEGDLSWASLTSSPLLIADCKQKARSYITSSFKYHQAPQLYLPTLANICESIESSDAFKKWLTAQGAGLEDKIFKQVLANLELRSETVGQICAEDYPSNALNKAKAKRSRITCMQEKWPDIVGASIDQSKSDPSVKKTGMSFDKITERLEQEKERLQANVVRKYFP